MYVDMCITISNPFFHYLYSRLGNEGAVDNFYKDVYNFFS